MPEYRLNEMDWQSDTNVDRNQSCYNCKVDTNVERK